MFVDADFNTNPEDSISISSYVITLAGGAISWRSHKQSNVATSTVHSEYMALYDVCTEVTWLKHLLEELGLKEFVKEPVKIFCDNNGTMKLAEGGNVTERTNTLSLNLIILRIIPKRACEIRICSFKEKCCRSFY